MSGVPQAQGTYVTLVVDGSVGYVAGMTPRRDGQLICVGQVGREVTLQQGELCARQAVENALAALSDGVGLARVRRVLRLSVYVACEANFTELGAVANAASDVLAEMFGPGQLPARSAIGVSSLPGGAPVEVELTASISPAAPQTPGN